MPPRRPPVASSNVGPVRRPVVGAAKAKTKASEAAAERRRGVSEGRGTARRHGGNFGGAYSAIFEQHWDHNE